MSLKVAKGKAVDTGDRHWSGVGKEGKFTVTFASTDTVGSRTTLPFVKVCACLCVVFFGVGARQCQKIV